MKFKIEDNKKKSKQESKIKIIIIREPNRKRLIHLNPKVPETRGTTDREETQKTETLLL